MNLKTALARTARGFAATVALAASLVPAMSAHAFHVGVDLNTYKASYGTDAATFRKFNAEFMYAITVNSDLTTAQWTTAYNALHGPNNWDVSEDNPPSGTNYQNQSYTQLMASAGHVNDSVCYNETGSTPGGTLLNATQITGEAGTHGGTVAVLTRDYNTTWPAWRTNTDACIANSKVTAVVMETSNPYANQDCAQLVTACLNANKRVYFLLPATNTAYAVQSVQYLLANVPNNGMADPRVNIIVYNYSGGSWFGGTNTSQGTLNQLVGMENGNIVSGHTYQILNANSGLALDDPAASKTAGQQMDQYAVNFANQQSWVATAVTGGWNFKNVASGLILEVLNSSQTSGAAVDQNTSTGAHNQLWTLTGNGDGTFKLYNYHSGLVMAVVGQSLNNSALVNQFTDNGTTDHNWVFKDLAKY